MPRIQKKVKDRLARAARVRKKVKGSSERPRLSVRRSLNHFYAQIFDDQTNRSLVQVGSTSKEIASSSEKKSKTDIAKMVGELLAEKAKAAGIETVVFDRKGYLYHGRVKAMAEAARSKGLKF